MRFQGPPKTESLNHISIPHVNNLPAKLIDGKQPLQALKAFPNPENDVVASSDIPDHFLEVSALRMLTIWVLCLGAGVEKDLAVESLEIGANQFQNVGCTVNDSAEQTGQDVGSAGDLHRPLLAAGLEDLEESRRVVPHRDHALRCGDEGTGTVVGATLLARAMMTAVM
jgi:hypothetical protein